MNDILRNIHSCGKDDVWNKRVLKMECNLCFILKVALYMRYPDKMKNTMSTLATYRL